MGQTSCVNAGAVDTLLRAAWWDASLPRAKLE